ncbi:hypothetical protein V8J88_02025 [Massilia sp. W12]|uniref:hypothetical protein n=1 Tax=Massilia sp. W12 TaxID=3126507 RepID=UPI0030CF0EDD
MSTHPNQNPMKNFDPSGLLYGLNFGECYGAAAAQYWANKHVDTGNFFYAIPGLFASAWTPKTSNATFGVLVGAMGGVGVANSAGNFSTWMRNPILYEVGQKTVSTAIYQGVAAMPVAARANAIIQKMGWFGVIFNLFGSWSKTWNTGATPGAALGLVAFGAGTSVTPQSGNCECE